jgi:hypothetical protein
MEAELDFEHLASCVDPHCLYCSDEEPERDPEVQAWLDALAAQDLPVAA